MGIASSRNANSAPQRRAGPRRSAVQRTRSGRDINDIGKPGPKKISAKQMVQKSLFGLQPTEVSKGFAKFKATKKMQESIASKRKNYADRFVNALKRDDQKAMDAIMAEIAKWNEKAAIANKPHRIIKIGAMIESRMKPGFKNIPKTMRWKALEIQKIHQLTIKLLL